MKTDLAGLDQELAFLYQRIADYNKYQHELVILTFTAISAIYAFAMECRNPYLFLISYMILIPIRSRHLFYHEMNIKLSTYISVFIQPQLQEVQWEARSHDSITEDSTAKNSFLLSRVHYFLHTIVAVCTLATLTCLLLFPALQLTRLKVVCLVMSFLFTAVVFRLDFILLFKSDALREYYTKRWEELRDRGGAV